MERVLCTRGSRHPYMGYVRRCAGCFRRTLQFIVQHRWRCLAETGRCQSQPFQTGGQIHRSFLSCERQATDTYVEASDVCGFCTCDGSCRTGRRLRKCGKDCICADTAHAVVYSAPCIEYAGRNYRSGKCIRYGEPSEERDRIAGSIRRRRTDHGQSPAVTHF